MVPPTLARASRLVLILFSLLHQEEQQGEPPSSFENGFNMAQINSCVKRTFTIFNILIAIVGGVIISLTLSLQGYSYGGQVEDIFLKCIVMYVFGTIMMAISFLGVFGVQRENRVALIVFLVCMVTGSLLLLRIGVTVAISSPEADEILETKFRDLLPLDKAPANVLGVVNSLQSNLQCCGLFSVSDWKNNIPDSCVCNAEQEMEGQCQTIPYLNIFRSPSLKSIFKETCFPVMMHYVHKAFNICLAVLFSLATLALLGMVLSSVMVHQLRPQGVKYTMILTIPSIISPQPPKYQELYNAPEYEPPAKLSW
ncbi:hypothetical protein NHX12_020350 [Muraenolepis orangiensis]|uniref:Tetraspanin n=1 Tax=Muraenolepis orangiensis TaxID=630683 RepID=A0A9Q0IW75_9TELE|nr:hypothetical protein NHX12_020350 [Muraenolepis orangiensis]